MALNLNQFDDASTRKIKRVVKEYLTSIQARPKRIRRSYRKRRGGGGKQTSVFAIVIEDAGASSHNVTGITGGTVGKAILLDAQMQKTSSDTDDAIEFKSLHFVGVPINAIVSLHSNQTIQAGSEFSSNPVWGQIIASPVELFELEGAEEKKALVIPEGGATPQQIKWLGKECPTP